MGSMGRQSSFRGDCLKGKVAFITGGGSGICKEIARQFMLHGASVAIASRDQKKLHDAAELLASETGGCCFPVTMDVRKESQVVSAVDAAMAKFGKIDILVNGAAGNFLCSAEKLSYKGFKTVMEIDAHGSFIVSKTVFEKCFKPAAQRADLGAARGLGETVRGRQSDDAGCGKVILNISMTLHYTATLLQTHAGVAKAAVDAMTKHLAVEWGPYNVRVNSIAPGAVADTVGLSKLNPFVQRGNISAHLESQRKSLQATDNSDAGATSRRLHPENGVDPAREGKKEDLEFLRQFTPLQRIGTAQDVAFTAVFLCLPESSFITGANVVVDGGQWMTSGNFTLLEPRQNEAWRNAPFRVEAKL
ncbi:2,4-dienoyl CoA reductase 2, peroxisomal family protein [Besnoitia besnoiti]|uniref:2,4-dienoyl-CoA reductase [(3E)-enoyl-CoA-producing] n=1 Tax=Besnoitia besnoiti TaxID=94643 RepID=A0A2A9MD56_BESBE|nr:2,4-dienoyl CoA reductase 2, peroxisomal family protein [Besnoitia besnoiti]PFH35144.1 2,4-dienoyl CoA reductase 2, peroxisomal family protein [Besnoitia besnoiti]